MYAYFSWRKEKVFVKNRQKLVLIFEKIIFYACIALTQEVYTEDYYKKIKTFLKSNLTYKTIIMACILVRAKFFASLGSKFC